jgi:hypothetical protein
MFLTLTTPLEVTSEMLTALMRPKICRNPERRKALEIILQLLIFLQKSSLLRRTD